MRSEKACIAESQHTVKCDMVCTVQWFVRSININGRVIYDLAEDFSHHFRLMI